MNVAVIRGSFADAHGNISLDQEPANVDIYAAALAAHNSGGKVIVQVRTAVEVGALPARAVRVPGAIVDAVVVDPLQRWATTWSTTRPCRARSRARPGRAEPQPFTVRQLIARRAADELREGAVLNYGFGIPDGVAQADRRARPYRPLLPDHRARHLWRRAARRHAVRLCAQRRPR